MFGKFYIFSVSYFNSFLFLQKGNNKRNIWKFWQSYDILVIFDKLTFSISLTVFLSKEMALSCNQIQDTISNVQECSWFKLIKQNKKYNEIARCMCTWYTLFFYKNSNQFDIQIEYRNKLLKMTYFDIIIDSLLY